MFVIYVDLEYRQDEQEHEKNTVEIMLIPHINFPIFLADFG